MATFVPVCRADQVPTGRGLSLEIEGLRVAVFNDAGAFHALYGRCPHAAGPLGMGWIDEGEAVCPLHQWRFKLASGRCSTDRGYSVHRFECEVREGVVWVAI